MQMNNELKTIASNSRKFPPDPGSSNVKTPCDTECAAPKN